MRRRIGADGPELIRPQTAGYVIPNDRIQVEGARLREGVLDNAELSATFTGPVDASSYATIIDDNVLVGKFGDDFVNVWLDPEPVAVRDARLWKVGPNKAGEGSLGHNRTLFTGWTAGPVRIPFLRQGRVPD